MRDPGRKLLALYVDTKVPKVGRQGHIASMPPTKSSLLFDIYPERDWFCSYTITIAGEGHCLSSRADIYAVDGAEKGKVRKYRRETRRRRCEGIWYVDSKEDLHPTRKGNMTGPPS